MTLYSIFEKPGAPEEAPVVIRDGFSWFPALLPPIHAALHGLWLSLLVMAAVIVGLVVLGGIVGGPAVVWLYLLLATFYGFEAATLRRLALGRRGWHFQGDLVAADTRLAELEWSKIREQRS